MNYEELTLAVCEASRETGQFILDEKNKVSAGDVEVKSLNSLVSYVDKNAEMQLVNALQKIVPEAGFITEEETATERGDRYNWIIDPLDGTTNFLHGIPPFAVSIALMEKQEIVLGVIYELTQRECFYAWRHGGAWCNGQAIHCSPTKHLADSLLATGFPYYDFDRMPQFLALIQDFFQKTRGLRRLGSAATDMAYVACGRFNGFFEYGLSPWDIAAGVILISEAGGEVSDFKGGKDYLFGGEVACGAAPIFGDFLQCIQQHMLPKQ